MFNIMIMSHGNLSAAMIESCELIVGKQEDIVAIPLRFGISPQAYLKEVIQVHNTLPKAPTVVLTDLFGGTPSNVAVLFSKDKDMACVTGVNLGMLIEAVMKREYEDDKDVRTIAQSLAETGKESCRYIETRIYD